MDPVENFAQNGGFRFQHYLQKSGMFPASITAINRKRSSRNGVVISNNPQIYEITVFNGLFFRNSLNWSRFLKYRKNLHKTKSDDVYVSACGHVSVIPKNDITKLLIMQAVTQVNFISETLAVINNEMKRLASLLPEYPVVSKFYGAGGILGSQLMAEISDIYRFSRKESLVCFAGLEVPPYQSGKFESENRSISKKRSPHLRKALFQVMDCLLKHAPADEPVFQFLDRKRAEGKYYYSYMIAGSAKFLRIYYARMKEFLDNLDLAE